MGFFDDVLGGVGSIFGGIGQMQAGAASAAGYNAQAKYLREAARLTKISNALKMTSASRDIYKTLGGARSDIAASGLKNSGTALDSLKASAQQGGLQKAIMGLQGRIEVTSLEGQAQVAAANASAASSGGSKGGIGSIIGGAASIATAFSDDRLKEDSKLICRRPDGIGIYVFRYKLDSMFYLGVMASEVESIKPDAVWMDKEGYQHVDYEMIGADFRCLGPEVHMVH